MVALFFIRCDCRHSYYLLQKLCVWQESNMVHSSKLVSKSRRYSKFRPVSHFVHRSGKKIGANYGFSDQFLITNWREVVGQELGQITRPFALKGARGKRGSTLVVECAGALASEVSMRTNEIIEKINSALGFEAISNIKLKHHVSGFAEDRPQFERKQESATRVPTGVDKSIASTASDDLKKALADIAQAYYHQKGKK